MCPAVGSPFGETDLLAMEFIIRLMPLLYENNRRLISSLVMSLIHRQWESNAGICYAVDAAGISCSPKVFLLPCHRDYAVKPYRIDVRPHRYYL